MISILEKKVDDSIQSAEEQFITSHFQFSFDIQSRAFAGLKEKASKINSPNFYGDPKHGDKWTVQFRHLKRDWAMAGLQLVHSRAKEQIHATYQICLVDKMNKIKWRGSVRNGTFVQGQECGEVEKFNIEAHSKTSSEWLVAGSLCFYIQVSTRRLKSELESESENQALVTKQVKSLLLNENYADVTLESDNVRFPASKIMLAAQSPAFAAMFNSDMKESKENVVKIKDVSAQTLKGFLEFVYTGETESLAENAGELLKISDKYQVLSLKQKCEKILLENLKVENALDILVLAHLHSPEKLLPKILRFVNTCAKDFENRDWLKEMKKEYPQIVHDLYEDMLK